MFAGHRLVPAGIWNEEQRIGRLLDLDRPLLEPSKSAMPKSTSLPHYLDQVLPRWQSLDEDGRHATKVSISIYAALPVDLEPAVVVGGMGLEHLAEALLPKKANSYDVPKVQRQVIFEGVRKLADEVAAGTQWRSDLDMLVGRLLQAPPPTVSPSSAGSSAWRRTRKSPRPTPLRAARHRHRPPPPPWLQRSNLGRPASTTTGPLTSQAPSAARSLVKHRIWSGGWRDAVALPVGCSVRTW